MHVTPKSRIIAFVVVWVAAFLCVYAIGSNLYTHKLYAERPDGVHRGNLGGVAEKTFRRNHPFLLFGLPTAIGVVAVFTTGASISGLLKMLRHQP